MRVPVSWLRDFAPFGPASDLVTVLDDLGLVVESVEEVGEGLEDVIVARVSSIDAIEGADRIRQVTVDTGSGELQVVCGAWNFDVGDLVPLAPVGTVLPGGVEIGRRKMRGVTSEGMLCSGAELRLSDDRGGLLVLGDESTGARPGTTLAEALGIERDSVLDIAVEANRPDALCMAGIARDLAARLGLDFALMEPPVPPTWKGEPPPGPEASVEVPDLDLCPRFTSHILLGFELAPSPATVARRLVLSGMRPVNNVVDASNYVMLELGQPTHPYDLDDVAGHRLRARAGRSGEVVVTLDGTERRVGERSVGPGDDRRDCLICDGDDAPIGIGGVMGGASSEVSSETKRVMLEAAYFTPMAVARTSKRLGLRTEASIRFERGCDPEGIDRSVRRLCEVLGESAGVGFGVHRHSVDVRGEVPGPARIRVRTGRLNAVLGSALDEGEIAGYLKPIGFGTEPDVADALEVTVPTFRPDVSREIDVIEEVARHHGYQSLPRRVRRAPQVGALNERQIARRRLRGVLAHLGAHEAWTPSLLAPGEHELIRIGPSITVSNPLTPEESVLRRSLMPGMLRALEFNLNRRVGGLRTFELGHVFPVPRRERVAAAATHTDPRLSVVDERELTGVLLAGPGDDATTAAMAWSVIAEAMAVTGVEVRQSVGSSSEKPGDPTEDGAGLRWAAGLHPTRRAVLVVGADGTVIGEVGEIDPEVLEGFGIDPARSRVGWVSFDFGLLAEAPRRTDALAPVSRYPSTDIDLAFEVPEQVPAHRVEETLRRAGGTLLERVWLFDVFRGPGMPPGVRSLAYRLRFCAPDRTLTDEEVAGLRSACIATVEADLGARIRR